MASADGGPAEKDSVPDWLVAERGVWRGWQPSCTYV